MHYINFKKTFDQDLLVSIKEIRKIHPTFNKIQLVQWQKKGYLRHIRRGYYLFEDLPIEERLLMYISNKLLISYISLETALSYHGFIPEGVYMITAVSTQPPRTLVTSIGVLRYQTIKSSYFFGYTYLPYLNKNILIASPEKAILDYFYLHPELCTANDFAELRINPITWKEKINITILKEYLSIMNNKALTSRIHTFISFMNTYDTNKHSLTAVS